MEPTTTAYQERAQHIGASIQNARQAAGKSAEDCAAVLGLATPDYAAIESGRRCASLPELETLAYYFETPVESLLEPGGRPAAPEEKNLKGTAALLRLRNRMIGALLRQARLDADYTLEALAERSGIEPARLEAYELGAQAVPMAELENLSGLLHRSIREFQDQHGPVGVWTARQRAIKDFQELPLELQVFVSKPVNRPYLELAIRLNDMSVDKLRAVAEGLLEITY
ncbi:MAG: helix-turn-helix domain-containing protein [Chloroflexota bacterium]